MDPDWKGFPIRLGMAIGRWPGGGQRKFAAALKEYADKAGINVPTSYRTLVNYLQGETRPSEAWVGVAADVLRTTPLQLLNGIQEDMRAGVQWTVDTAPETHPRTDALVHSILNHYFELPFAARQTMYYVAEAHFANDFSGWLRDEPFEHPDGEVQVFQVRNSDKVTEIREVIADYFGPLLSHPKMGELAAMALASSLAAAAYLRLAAPATRKEP